MSRICVIFIAMLTLFPEAPRTTPEERAMIEAIANLPRPRQVRAKGFDLITMVTGDILFICAWFVVFGDFWRSKFLDQPISECFLLSWLIFVPFVLVKNARDFVRDQKLLTYGEVALGRIFEVRAGRHGRRIQYSFQDLAGRVMAASSRTDSRKASEGSAVPVFFDPSNPQKRCVPLCSSSWEIVNPKDATSGLSRRFMGRS